MSGRRVQRQQQAGVRMSLLGGRVLVTGATGGLGQAIAREFAARGASLVLTGRRGDVLDSLAQQTSAQVVACDLADRAEVQRLITAAGEVDVLVANAALPASGDMLAYAQEDIDRALEVNLRAPIALTRALVPGMLARGRGHVVLMSSLQGRAPTVGAAVYVATKFALRGFALALREDLRKAGIGVSVVMPGFIREAGMFADSGAKLPAGVGTRTPQQVADGVVRAIERNLAEIDIAPFQLRAGATFAGLLPDVSAAVSRLMGSHKIAAAVSAGQADKR